MYELFKHQDEFLYSTHRHTGLVGGYRSGKTFVGTLKTISKKIQYPKIDVAYYLPTVSLIKDIAYDRFCSLLENQNIEYSLNQSDKTFHTKFGKIYLRSMDNPHHIVGYEVGYSLIDEVDVVHRNKIGTAFKNILARNSARLPNGDNPQLDFVSTPEGFGFLYNFFIKNESENKLLIKARTTDNKYITDEYINSLREEFSEKQLLSYLNGEFTNLENDSVYSNFDRKDNHTDIIAEENDTLHIGMDFNIGKMAAIVHVIKDGQPIAVDEFINYYDTDAICRAIKERYTNKSIVYPDASGAARSTSGMIDHNIIKSHGFGLLSKKKNPFIKDRVGNMNVLFKGRKGIKYMVNTHNCAIFTECLERQAYKNNEPDKTSDYDHPNEAAGYFLWYRFSPITRITA